MTINGTIKIAIAGLGAIGLKVARSVDAGAVPGMALSAVSARDSNKAVENMKEFSAPVPVVPLNQLAQHGDVVVECTPARVFLESAEPTIKQGRCLMPLSVGMLVENWHLVAMAEQSGAVISVPTGALVGLDTVRAMAVGEIYEVRLETRKPPAGLAGAPYLRSNRINLDGLTEALCVFRGSAREAVIGFPANVNVAAALALASLGPDETQIEIWADPAIDRNIQKVTIRSDSGEASMTMLNIPSEENPRTGRIVANSVIAALRRQTARLVIGS